MEFIKPVISSEPSELFCTAFGISEERSDQLATKLEKELESISEEGFTSAGYVALFVKHAETVEEVAFLSYKACELISDYTNPFRELMDSLHKLSTDK
mgnify:CR=1 FL=1